jgi:hypothetical protein
LSNTNTSKNGMSGASVTRSLVFCVVFCGSLFVLLWFFLSSFCCLSFFELRIVITQKKKGKQSSDQKKKGRRYSDQKKKGRQYSDQKKKGRQSSDQKDDQRSSKHYTEN